MTGGAAIRLRKELRTLVWPWAASMAGVGLVALREPALSSLVAVPGALVLGAWAIGSEYSQRTLAGLLVQPVPRWQLGVEKLVVVLVLIATLVVPAVLSPAAWSLAGGLVLAAVLAASLAAVLTMLTRTPRTGLIFAAAAMFAWALFTQRLPHLVALFLPELAADPRTVSATLLIYGTGTLALLSVSAVLVTFARLEALEETHEHVSLHAWRVPRSDAPATRARHPLIALAAKELALQQVLLLVTGFYVFGWLLFSLQELPLRLTMAHASTTVQAGVIALLAGAMTSAEERRFGTVATQVLQPVPFLTQWMVKTGVTIGLVVTLAVGVPALLIWLDPTVSIQHTSLIRSPEGALLLVGLTVGATYVSSLSRSSLVAFVVAIPVCWAFVLGGILADSAFRRPWGWTRDAMTILSISRAVAVALFLTVVCAFAMQNHVAADRPRRRLTLQATAMATYILAASVALGLFATWLRS